jgi:signal transduction histidine kinase
LANHIAQILFTPFQFIYRLTGTRNNNALTKQLELFSALLLIVFFSFIIALNFKVFYLFQLTTETTKDLQLHLFVSGVLGFIFIITLIQYFFFRDSTYLFYCFYLLLNLYYFTVCYIRFTFSIKVIPAYLISLTSGIYIPALVSSYAVYTLFAIRFLDVKNTSPSLYALLRKFTTAYFMLNLLSILNYFILRNSQASNIINAVILIACMPLGLISILIAYWRLRTKMASIFIIGSCCFLVGSVLGFIWANADNPPPFAHFPFNRWIFYTKMGMLLEIILFSSSFTYRIKVMEQEKRKTQQDLLMQMMETENKNKKLQSIRDNIAKDLHDEIGSTLTSIKILSQVSQKNLEKNPNKSAAMINMITDQSAQMQQSMSDIVWAINPDKDKLENILVRMREYVSQTLENKDVRTTFNVDENILLQTIDMGQRRDIFLIFKEAINNIVKYAQCSQVNISIQPNENGFCMQIKDNGIGFDTSKDNSSNGLKNMQARAVHLKGTVDIASQLGKGSIITLNLSTT